ncbi:MAG: flippase-like domain-containing protein, partial [Chitinophagaceae bacterium]|nr:flippase-like domain-containing protein [Chitinophagaceae bacterium]
MSKTLVNVLKYAFFIALAVLFVWLSIRGLNEEKWRELKDALSRANYLLVFPILFMLLLSNWLRMLRWRMLIEPMGYHPSRINMFLAILIGYFVNYGAPRLGEVIKCTILARYEKVPADKLVGTIVAERAVDLVSLVIVFGITFIIQFDVISTMTMSSILPALKNADGTTSTWRIAAVAGGLILFFFLVRFLFSRFG